jgi:hypothetical protein
MIPLPTPDRVHKTPRYWHVWFVVKGGQGQEYRLVMVPL